MVDSIRKYETNFDFEVSGDRVSPLFSRLLGTNQKVIQEVDLKCGSVNPW